MNSKANPQILKEIFDQIKGIIRDELGDYHASVFLYGSWARGEEEQSSDIDVAIFNEEVGLPKRLIMTIRDRLEESTVPYHVDVVDLSKVNRTFREEVLKEGIEWNVCGKE